MNSASYNKYELNYIFETNSKDFKINKKNIGEGHKVILIDDFYKRPELVVKFLFEHPMINNDLYFFVLVEYSYKKI